VSTSAPRWPLGIPSRLRPVEVLGIGGSSVVWRVRDTEIGADLAVKVIDTPGGRGGGSGGGGTGGGSVGGVHGGPADGLDLRIETEARALARLRDVDGVLPLHELGLTEDGAAWLACDLVTGGTLADRAPVGAGQLVTIGATVAGTLAAAHLLEVVHGDVTPTNIVFDGADGALLADFGLAGLGHAPGDPGGLTPAYAAPERLRGAVPSAASDVYGLGASLASVGTVSVTAATTSPAGLPAELRDVLDRCCVEHPGHRPTAAALAAELAELD